MRPVLLLALVEVDDPHKGLVAGYMSLQGLMPLLSADTQFRKLLTNLQLASHLAKLQIPDSATAYVLAALWQRSRFPAVVIVPRPEHARRLVDELLLWCGSDAPVMQFPESENLQFERIVSDPRSTQSRLSVLRALIDSTAQITPPFVVSSVSAAINFTVALDVFKQGTHTIRRGDGIRLQTLVERWIQLGYRQEPAVEVPGTSSRRGGIVDIWPVGADAPSRLEFFDDEIESVRVFDPATQRSSEETDQVTVIPATEILPAVADRDRIRNLVSRLDFRNCTDDTHNRIVEELEQIENGEFHEDLGFYASFYTHGSIFDYIPDDAHLMVMRESEIEVAAEYADQRLEALRHTKEERCQIPRQFPPVQFDKNQLFTKIQDSRKKLFISPWGVDHENGGGNIRLPFEPAPALAGNVDDIWIEAKKLQTSEARLVAVSTHSERLRDLAAKRGITATAVDSLSVTPPSGSLAIAYGSLNAGFIFSGSDSGPLTVISDREIFGVTKQKRSIQRHPARSTTRLSELSPGVFVVHVEHGVARFVGTKTLEGEATREYLVLAYADNDKLYVPTEHLDRIELYRSSGERPPRLTRLGTQEWKRAKDRARRSTEQIAGELIALYAARSASEGLSTDTDTPWQSALEASFPYEETPDQVATLDAVKADLESKKPLDRLICGDVGYGKTEIALRAAFKVVQAGRQVAILVPTTVLAQQHSATFQERLGAYPISVQTLSRFRKNAEQRQIVKGLLSGTVDICIGTHRLLQQDVIFKNLGLVVVDEEHRFGVSHKERLKRMRAQVDVLALSATPIPRTLHMSLSGVRDMSTMETPPDDRLPIKTYVSEESAELVREAILREIDRGGQIFYLHNRVKDIDYIAQQLRRIVPEATVRIGHGQMPEEQLEGVMAEFAQGRFNVLVCTTIIESGIDLPNVNTLIVNRSDMFGLSQLYQLRGRIGRGANRAYAYFLIQRGRRLTEAAEQRLNSILAAAGHGAGFQLAMRDLEIRGIGNILGPQQSGHIAAIGFELYIKLLAQATSELKTEGAGDTVRKQGQELSNVRVDLGLDAHIPNWYVEDLTNRLSIYRRLARVSKISAVNEMHNELRDRFGPVPKPVDHLLDAIRVRIVADQCGVDSIIAKDAMIVLALREPTGGARIPLQAQLGEHVTVGHMQLRVAIEKDDPKRLRTLFVVLSQLSNFRARVLKMIPIA